LHRPRRRRGARGRRRRQDGCRLLRGLDRLSALRRRVPRGHAAVPEPALQRRGASQDPLGQLRAALRHSGAVALLTQQAPRAGMEAKMTDKIRVGIVGATVTQGGSGWGTNAHVPALNALPDYELNAVCTAHEDTAKASAAAFGAARGFDKFGDMAADRDID